MGSWLKIGFEGALAGDITMATEKDAVVTDGLGFIADGTRFGHKVCIPNWWVVGKLKIFNFQFLNNIVIF